MYNLFKFEQQLQKQQQQIIQNQKQQIWQQKHQELKQQSHQKYAQKISSFVKQTAKNPFYFQDDHFQQWRNNNRYRDTKQQSKFLGFKTFVHKPNQQMISILNQRQRKQKQQLQRKSMKLVQDNLIPQEQKSRSLRSQGPLIKPYSFRDKTQDNRQPQFRFKSITDKQKFIQHYIPQSKFLDTVYTIFDKKKKSIGFTKVSPIKPKTQITWRQKINNTIELNNTFDLNNQNITNNGGFRRIQSHEQKPTIIENVPNTSQHYFENIDRKPLKLNNVIQQINKVHLGPLKKMHFKGVKQLALGSPLSRKKNNSLHEISEINEINITRHHYENIKNGEKVDKRQDIRGLSMNLLKQCQYDRQKHLQNIKNNLHYERYEKNPIL